MGFFISYRHTGENSDRLQQLLPAVKQAFHDANEPVYCTYFEDHAFRARYQTPKEVMAHALKKIDEFKGLFVIQDSSEKSEGMLMEVGYCLGKGYPVFIATRKNVTNTYLPSMVSHTLEYEDIPDLAKKIRSRIYDQ